MLRKNIQTRPTWPSQRGEECPLEARSERRRERRRDVFTNVLNLGIIKEVSLLPSSVRLDFLSDLPLFSSSGGESVSKGDLRVCAVPTHTYKDKHKYRYQKHSWNMHLSRFITFDCITLNGR